MSELIKYQLVKTKKCGSWTDGHDKQQCSGRLRHLSNAQVNTRYKEPVLQEVFPQGFSDHLCDELAPCDKPPPLWPSPWITVWERCRQQSLHTSTLPSSFPPLEQLQLPALLCVGNMVLPLWALISSGSQESLLDENLEVPNGCSLGPWLTITVTALDGRIIARVTNTTGPITLPNPLTQLWCGELWVASVHSGEKQPCGRERPQ